jgi:mono/diheme cytochrome c family protein
MNSPRIAVSLVAVGLAVAPVLGAAEKLDAAAATKGETTYVRYCVSCHGKTGKGDGPLAGDLRVAVPDLTTLASRSGGTFPFDRVVRIIGSGEAVRGHGTEDMPAWGDAFKKTKGIEEKTVEAAVRNLAHYLLSVQRPAK